MLVIGAIFLSCATAMNNEIEINKIDSTHNIPFYQENEYMEIINYELFNNLGIIIRREIYQYTGGAHGIQKVEYIVLDLAGKRVLKFDDFFREGVEQRLYNIVINELRQYNNSHGHTILEENQPLSQGIFFTDNPMLTNNFFISNNGFGLNWQPYEIAPYYTGNIEIIIPWRTIRPLLQHEIMELLEKFGIYMFMGI